MRSIYCPLVCMTICLFAVACQNDGTASNPGDSMPLTPRRPQQAATDLRAVPVNVQASFAHDYPDAAVTSTQVITPSSGPMSYKFVFMHDGHPVEAVYDYNGRLLTPAAIPMPARPGFPDGAPRSTPPAAATPAPTASPDIPESGTPLPRGTEGP